MCDQEICRLYKKLIHKQFEANTDSVFQSSLFDKFIFGSRCISSVIELSRGNEKKKMSPGQSTVEFNINGSSVPRVADSKLPQDILDKTRLAGGSSLQRRLHHYCESHGGKVPATTRATSAFN